MASDEQPSERLHKVLAAAGVASRRKAEELIRAGRVTVNGRVITQLGTKVSPGQDDIRLDGQPVRVTARHVYILVNKPRGVLATMHDPRGRKALGDLVVVPQRLYPVGRLDVMSEGLILLTDDGDLANRLTHPRYGHEKEYRVRVAGRPSEETLEAWRRGVVLEGERTAPAQVELVGVEKDTSVLRIVMHEGRKRQIRDVASLLGHPVLELQRVRLGPLRLGALPLGQWRSLTDKEIAQLTALKGQPAGSDRRAPRAPGGEPPKASAVRSRGVRQGGQASTPKPPRAPAKGPGSPRGPTRNRGSSQGVPRRSSRRK